MTPKVKNTPGRITLAALLFTSLLIGVVVTTDAKQSKAAATAQPAGSVTGPLGNYSVLSRPAVASDDVSGWRIHEDRAGRGLRFTDSRLVFTDSAREVAAVPAPDGPCLLTQFVDGSGGLVCGDRDRPVVMLGYDGAIGLVPDSVEAVTFTMVDGTTETTPVDANLWHSPVEAAKATYTLNGRTEELELMPRSSLPKGATLHPNGMVTGGDVPPGLSG